MRLTDVVATSVVDTRAPAAALAVTYATLIDEAAHVPTGLAAALELLRLAAEAADEAACGADDENVRAYRRVAAAVSAVTVTGDLGPKLLTALDALLLTPKARAAAGQALGATAQASPLQTLRARHDGRRLHSVG